jgi:hypothetical protein
MVLLGWLKHVSVCVTRSERTAANPVWNRRNVRVVLQQATSLLGAGPVAHPSVMT